MGQPSVHRGRNAAGAEDVHAGLAVRHDRQRRGVQVLVVNGGWGQAGERSPRCVCIRKERKAIQRGLVGSLVGRVIYFDLSAVVRHWRVLDVEVAENVLDAARIADVDQGCRVADQTGLHTRCQHVDLVAAASPVLIDTLSVSA